MAGEGGEGQGSGEGERGASTVLTLLCASGGGEPNTTAGAGRFGRADGGDGTTTALSGEEEGGDRFCKASSGI